MKQRYIANDLTDAEEDAVRAVLDKRGVTGKDALMVPLEIRRNPEGLTHVYRVDSLHWKNPLGFNTIEEVAKFVDKYYKGWKE